MYLEWPVYGIHLQMATARFWPDGDGGRLGGAERELSTRSCP